MDRDYIFLGLIILGIFLLSLFISYSVKINLFPIFNPMICYDSYLPNLCEKLWIFMEISIICVIFYFVIGKKRNERIRS